MMDLARVMASRNVATNRLPGLLILLALCLVCALRTSAQEPTVTNATNVGFPMNGVFDGTDFENVQITNGGLQIEIPLWSSPGRNGLNVTYKYVYSNKQWAARDTYHSRNDTWLAEIRPEQSQILNGIIMRTTGSWGYGVTQRISTVCGYFSYVNYVLTEPNDLHMVAIFDGVSIEFAEEYLCTREWCRDAVARGWNFYLLPEILAERLTIQ